jgi:hypothetical protein
MPLSAELQVGAISDSLLISSAKPLTFQPASHHERILLA